MKNIAIIHLRENTKKYILLLGGREGFLMKNAKTKIISLINLTTLTWKSSIRRLLNVSYHTKRLGSNMSQNAISRLYNRVALIIKKMKDNAVKKVGEGYA